jgi:hypothetical protein
MRLLDQFISQTGREPENWTNHDIQKYCEYLQTHVSEFAVSIKYDDLHTTLIGNDKTQWKTQ